MRYTYYQRGRCQVCGDAIWTNHKINSVVCKCGHASIFNDVVSNVDPMTDEEHKNELLKGDFWWLPYETLDPSIDLIRG